MNPKPSIPLPKGWPTRVQRESFTSVIALAQASITFKRSWAVNSRNARIRLRSENDRLTQEVALLLEEIRIKDARMSRTSPNRRPHYPPTERMAILELRAARSWSIAQTAEHFHIPPATISSWMGTLDEEGPTALVQIREPVNRFPDFVRHIARRLKVLCPSMGKVKIAQTLARAGLHLTPTTVGRILRENPPQKRAISATAARQITAKGPDGIWHLDLTPVPTSRGFWVPWMPLALIQKWPFCWWIAAVIDNYSRKAMGIAVYPVPSESTAASPPSNGSFEPSSTKGLGESLLRIDAIECDVKRISFSTGTTDIGLPRRRSSRPKRSQFSAPFGPQRNFDRSNSNRDKIFRRDNRLKAPWATSP